MGPGGLNWELGLACFFALGVWNWRNWNWDFAIGTRKKCYWERKAIIILELKNGIRIRIL